jgi:hypothetical protein
MVESESRNVKREFGLLMRRMSRERDLCLTSALILLSCTQGRLYFGTTPRILGDAVPRLKILALGLIASILYSFLSASTGSQSVVHSPGRTPLAFTKNMGQWDERILFIANAGGATMWIAQEGVTYRFTRRSNTGNHYDRRGMLRVDDSRDSIEQLVITTKFIGANPNPIVVGEGQMDYKCNYFLGNNPTEWHTDVPNYESITLKDIYPGIDLKYSGDGNGEAAYRFIADPGTDISQIKVAFEGAEETSLDADGRMVVKTKWGDMVAPIKTPINQDLSGVASFSWLSEEAIGFETGGSTKFTLNGSNRHAMGTLSVGLVYSTYIGGGNDDYGKSIAVDDSGNAYVTGYTSSASFPTLNPYQASQGGYDVFVTKLSSLGNGLIYSTYLGGEFGDYGSSITVDSSGNAYITGYTLSSSFPTLNPIQTDQIGYDAFVTKLSSAGNSLIYSTYLGGEAIDYGNDIAVDDSGNAYITGSTGSALFPRFNPFQKTYRGGYCDAFVTKLTNSGDGLIYSTYFGGSNSDYGFSIAIDDSGSAYITGETWSTDLPILNAYESTFQGADEYYGGDAFVTKFSSSGNSIVYSTYLGGASGDGGSGIAVDSSDNAYISGSTYSSDFPTQNPYQSTFQGFSDAFVTKLSSSGNSLVYSTYLGGIDGDHGYGIAVSAGEAYLTGVTASTNFPILRAYDASFNGGVSNGDAFVTRLNKSGKHLLYSTFLGGEGDDIGACIALDDSGQAYVTGHTTSSSFPTWSPFQTDQGGTDAFVTKFSTVPPYLCADANADESINISDAVYLIAYILAGGPEPSPLLAGDANCDQAVNISDAVYLIAYIFAGGPKPCAGC